MQQWKELNIPWACVEESNLEHVQHRVWAFSLDNALHFNMSMDTHASSAVSYPM